jgi:hypothetical protein
MASRPHSSVSRTRTGTSRPRKSSLRTSPPPATGLERVGPPTSGMLAAAQPLSAFLATVGALGPGDRALIVVQAIVLLEGFYAHMPLKRAMHAVDPLQRLRLLRHRLEQLPSELAFHAEMTEIFTSLRDLHTNYLLPDPFRGAAAALPFRVESFIEGGVRKFLAILASEFSHPTFVTGVEVLHWNGIPIERAVEIAAARHAGSNPEARFARGLAGLTARPMMISPPPDEVWVIFGYRTADGREIDVRINWTVTGLPAEHAVDPEAPDHRAAALGIDLETDAIRQIHRALFAPQTIEAGVKFAASSDPLSLVRSTESIMPGVFIARAVSTSYGEFGYIRIFTFSVTDADAFVQEFIRLAGLLPQNGLIVDVRDNGGGLIYAGERLLQVLTPGRIEARTPAIHQHAFDASTVPASWARCFCTGSMGRIDRAIGRDRRDVLGRLSANLSGFVQRHRAAVPRPRGSRDQREMLQHDRLFRGGFSGSRDRSHPRRGQEYRRGRGQCLDTRSASANV